MVLQRTVNYNNDPINWMEIIVHYEPMALNPEEKVIAAINNDVIFCCWNTIDLQKSLNQTWVHTRQSHAQEFGIWASDFLPKPGDDPWDFSD